MGRTSDAREKLLRVGFDLMWCQSYTAVSVDDICARADVRKGSFYHFFPSKADLACAAYEEFWQSLRPELDAMFSPQVPPLERLDRYAAYLLASAREMKQSRGRVLGCPFSAVGVELSGIEDSIRRKSEEISQRARRYLESALSDAMRDGVIPGGDSGALAQAIHSLKIGLMAEARIRNDPEVIAAFGPLLRRMVGAPGTIETAARTARAAPAGVPSLSALP